MRNIRRTICCTLLALAAGCASNTEPGMAPAQGPTPSNSLIVCTWPFSGSGIAPLQGPVLWGKTVDGLQVGVAGEAAPVAPRQASLPDWKLQGVRIYLRNNGQLPIRVVDLNGLDFNRKPGDPAVVDFAISGGFGLSPDGIPGLLFRPSPARVTELAPGQTISSELGITVPQREGGEPMVFGIIYRNPDPVVQVADSTGANAPRTSSGIWTGAAMSGLMQAN